MPPFPTDEQHQYFQLRPGVGAFKGWRGMKKDGDPGSVPADQFRHARDVRFSGGIVKQRPPEVLVANLSGIPYFLGNFQLNNPRKRLFIGTQGCSGVLTGTGSQLSVYDTEVSPVLQIVSSFSGPINNKLFFGSLGDRLFFGFDSLFRELPLIESPTGGGLSANQASLPLKKFTGYSIVGMLESPEIGKLFIGLQDTGTPANGKIFSYDGLTFTEEYSGLRPFAFGRWRNRIVAGFAGSIRWRDQQSTTWTSVALGGFTCHGSQTAMAEYVDKLYIAGGGDILYSFDGTTLAVARTIVGCAVGESTAGCVAVANHRGLLHYLWNTTVTFRMKLGRFDFDSSLGALPYIDTWKDLYVQNNLWLHGGSLTPFRSTLFAGRGDGNIIGSPMSDVLGTWIDVYGTASGGSSFPLSTLFPF